MPDLLDESDIVPAPPPLQERADLVDVSKVSSQPHRLTTHATSKRGRNMLIGLGSLGFIGAIGSLLVFLLRPTWEQAHEHEIRQLVDGGHDAANQKRNRAAFEAYDRAVAIAKGHTITDSMLRGDVDAAQAARDRLYPLVQGEIEHERQERERMAREAEANRLAQVEADRRATEAAVQAKSAAEAERKRQAAEALARTAEAARVATVCKSAAFKSIIDNAQTTHRQAAMSLITEDSAYRAISKSADVDFDLIGLLTRQEAMIAGENIDASLDQVRRMHDVDLASEESAIRAIYKHDQATLQELGVLAEVWGRDAATKKSLMDCARQLQRLAASKTQYDDSAPRAIVAFNDGEMRIWEALANARAVKVDNVIAEADRGNALDDSTWRIADRTANAQVRIVASILRVSRPASSNHIEQQLSLDEVGEDSALRSLATKKKLLSDALLALISERGS